MKTMTPNLYAHELLREIGLKKPPGIPEDSRSEALLWATSGAQYLTGEPDGPSLPSPAPLATCAQGAWLALSVLSEGTLAHDFPACQLLGERAALLGLQRQGPVSVGGACRLLDCADGQLALSLARPDDWRLLPAWLERDADSWEAVSAALSERSCPAMVARGRLLGLAAAPSGPPLEVREWFKAMRLAPAVKRVHRQPLVIDLSSLWAGPLGTQLLGQLGARVIKVESSARPDGARKGSPQFFDLLNAGKESVVLDLATVVGRRQLRELLVCADIVVESSRPRALEQMGIRAADIVREGDGAVWLSITGYGRDTPMREWIAYGDDAGVSAGLTWLQGEASGSRVFCGDAIADPLTALHAALLAWTAWTRGGGVLLDLSLYGVLSRCIAAGHANRGQQPSPPPSTPPRARSVSTGAEAFGSSTSAVLREQGIEG